MKLSAGRALGQDVLAFTLLVMAALCFLSSPCPAKSKKSPQFPIRDTGAAFPIDYEKYGEFKGRGTDDYAYILNDKAGLAKAMGSGLYPPSSSLNRDPRFKRWKKRNRKRIDPWEYVNTGDPQVEFYVWSEARSVGPGAKLFFTAKALEDGGHIAQALKAYTGVLVHFPKEPVWSADHTFVWYLGPAAVNEMESISTHDDRIGYRLKGAVCEVENGDDTDFSNDRFVIDPGYWVKKESHANVDLSALKIIQTRGYGRVRLVQFENKHWQLWIDQKPFVVHGLTYNPTTVGKHISSAANRWQFLDTDENGEPDAPMDAWVDRNKNGRMDSGETPVGDFELMRRMGANVIRMYRNSDQGDYDPSEFNKELLRKMNAEYGIFAVMGDFLGAYTVGSGAMWEDGTDYTDPVQLQNMRTIVRDYVKDHRHEPYLLMWLLGNENLMASEYGGVNATRTKAGDQVKEYLSFVNEIAEMIHQLDPDHPVAVGNLGVKNLKEHALYAPAVDVVGVNSYRGKRGFGDLWKKVHRLFDRPVLITEYGCDAYNSRDGTEDQDGQAGYLQGAWEDIQLHLAGGPEQGNAIGGIIFEYVDEWWKSIHGGWDTHEKTKDYPMAFPDGWSSEEWMGIVSQGNGLESPFLRQPRKAYYLYKNKLWK